MGGSQNWDQDDSGIELDGAPQHYFVTFPISVRLMCLGVGDRRDMSPAELAHVEHAAGTLHRRAGYAGAPDPGDLAALASVRLARLPANAGMSTVITTDVALYEGLDDPRDDGLAKAFALSSSLVMRHALPWTDVFRWRLAAELLIPTWSILAHDVDHPSVPMWLIEQGLTRCASDEAHR